MSTISLGMMSKLKEKITNNEKLFYLPNFIENEKYKLKFLKNQENPFLKELGLNSNINIVMYSGTLNEKLSYFTLLETISKFKNQKNILWIISGEGPIKNLIQKKLKGFDNVLILPFQTKDKLPLWLNLADIHLIPQKVSTADLVLPSKLLGILSSCKPVIGFAKKGSELGNILDLCGVRIEKEDPALLTKEINNLLHDKQLRLKLGIKGRDYVKKNFEKEIVLHKLFLKINEEIIGLN